MRLPLLMSVVVLTLCGAIGAAIGAPAEGGGESVYQVDPRAAGVVIGGILGQKITRRMDVADERMAADAEYRALEFGEPGTPTSWENPLTQHGGVIVPAKPYVQGDEYCRAYTHTIDLGGASETLSAVACRKPNGTWRAG